MGPKPARGIILGLYWVLFIGIILELQWDSVRVYVGVKPLCDDSVQNLLPRLMPEMYSDGLTFGMGWQRALCRKRQAARGHLGCRIILQELRV